MWFVGGAFVGLGNNTYQLVINTGTPIITFLMVFIIQNTQNRDGSAVQAKLDAQSEVLRRIAEKLDIADDEDLLTRLVGVEDAPASVISEDQARVRKAAIETGRHGAARDAQRSHDMPSAMNRVRRFFGRSLGDCPERHHIESAIK